MEIIIIFADSKCFIAFYSKSVVEIGSIFPKLFLPVYRIITQNYFKNVDESFV